MIFSRHLSKHAQVIAVLSEDNCCEFYSERNEKEVYDQGRKKFLQKTFHAFQIKLDNNSSLEMEKHSFYMIFLLFNVSNNLIIV